MKKLVFTALIGLALVGFTGCISGMMGGADVEESESSEKCASSGKCSGESDDGEKKCSADGKCAS